MRQVWLTLICGFGLLAANDDAPGWMKELASVSVPPQSAKVAAYVLWDEEAITVEATGRKIFVRRQAVRILNGKGGATARRWRVSWPVRAACATYAPG